MIRPKRDIKSIIRSCIGSTYRSCIRPLLLPVVLAEQLVQEIYAELNTQHHKLDLLQNSAGQHEYKGVQCGDPLELDFVSTTRRLNFIGNEVAMRVLRIKALLSTLDQVDEWERGFQGGGSMDHPAGIELDNVLTEGRDVLTTKIAYLRDTCNILLFEAEYEDKRVHALSQTVSRVPAE